MPSDRLREAMKRTSYTSEKTAKATQFTGKADEQQVVPPGARREVRNPEAVKATTVRPGVRNRAKRVRETTAAEVNAHNTAYDQPLSVDGTDALEPKSTRQVQTGLAPDPFPLQYRNGDPDAEFDS